MNKNKLKFVFRVNGNKEIGMGHLMRCLYLAEYLQGPSLFLINGNGAVVEKVKAFGHDYRVISSLTPKDFEVMIQTLESYPNRSEKIQPSEAEEIQEMKKWLCDVKNLILITDLLSPSDHYLRSLKAIGHFLVSIDEMGQVLFPSNLVFNCNAVSHAKKYKTAKTTKIYMGKQFALLKDEFLNGAGLNIKEKVKKILVTCGGTDMKGLSIKVLKALKNFAKEIEVVLIKGFDFKFETELNSLLREIKPIQVLKNVQNMREQMLSADIAFASGGTTMYELAALGVPSIILDQYEHQNEFASEMEREGALLNLGLGVNADSKRIENAVFGLLPFKKRKEMSLAAKKAIDGRGASRVAQIIQEHVT
ncbi:MAG: UDP-2,4-diacetamido-2,4,6-trideoxy-beta-L-altropyranose hydrolase [Deltaproteobacteria bacterium RIFCSPLOWO2_01_44_7]|nr:MAG: UDP-2,4-diacetamido-2,4,6-trideoxy-beta-L-altropyranose hydrolase [Deltaproteobacteria bacterium RIFCSPHIGHO2_01_FULL_43_49]OGQ16087.1 MAG: UDP-2,4-diacetamido-2,4,6-trideoxy-beta-L-altropyranose hydrolase [Deltaproteobacteria bacterium RIFCSPHIGHO2_02_FULL_44_53]OGQ29048.1 MAG: UDP-2,4-diacetamido-2,4,6-trideoxy-beta-L-altropyranose hydrolase [Deltaproteobacteria bacterium RIFCSPHIGHO2_12_FULL_44_21]OGQ32604.1 MAG: UDP-2,4-diacetamido-2,4,6-trideoxy-beta-L-altropyranose hydrolase [Delta